MLIENTSISNFFLNNHRLAFANLFHHLNTGFLFLLLFMLLINFHCTALFVVILASNHFECLD